MEMKRLRKCIFLTDLKELGYDVIAWLEPDGMIYCDIHRKDRIISGLCCVRRGVVYGVKTLSEDDECFLRTEISKNIHGHEHGFLSEVHDRRKVFGYYVYVMSLIFVLCHIIIGIFFLRVSDSKNVSDMYMMFMGIVTIIFVSLIVSCRCKHDVCGLDIRDMSDKMKLLQNGEEVSL